MSYGLDSPYDVKDLVDDLIYSDRMKSVAYCPHCYSIMSEEGYCPGCVEYNHSLKTSSKWVCSQVGS